MMWRILEQDEYGKKPVWRRRTGQNILFLVLITAFVAFLAGCGGGGGPANATLNIAVTGEGSVSPAPGAHSYPKGAAVTLTATPAEGWAFSGWEGDAAGIANPLHLTMDGNKSVTAVFERLQHQLATSVEPAGAGSIIETLVASTYLHGQTVSLRAMANDGWEFYRWEGDLTGSANPQSLVMNGLKSVTAVFTSPRYLPLGGGVAVDVSGLNGANHIYTMVTAQPAGKPESNDPPETIYPYTFTTTAAGSAAHTPSGAGISNGETSLAGGRPYASPPTYRGQAELDEGIRRLENEVLATGQSQVSPLTASKAPPGSPAVGTTWDNVHIAATGNYISTTCRYVSAQACFFVDNRDIVAMEPCLESYGAAFDAIHAVNRARFGTENDVDGNGKVIVVFSRELTGGLLGYFYAIDKFPDGTFPDTPSNEGDIFYITTDAEYQGEVVCGTLAHEFQHMIYFDEHYDRDVLLTFTWLNEALSQAAEYYNGYLENHHTWIAYFLDGGWIGLSLTHWTSANYGYGAVYIRYLIDQYGDAAIRDMCATEEVGVAAVEAATGEDFNTIFDNFTRALVMSGTGDTQNPLYNFTTLDLQDVQPNGRGGLTTTSLYAAGDTIDSGGLYSYRLSFIEWAGDFGTMNLSGSSMAGTVFGLSR